MLDGHDDVALVDDHALIRGVRRGEMDAVDQLFRAHHAAARRLALVLTGQPADADDLAADAVLRVWRALDAGTEPHNLRGYVLQVVRNLHIDGVRRRGREVLGSVVPDRSTTTPGPADRIAETHALAAAMATLPARQRSMLWDTVVEGYSPHEAAERHGLDHANAASQLAFRARRSLRRAYGD